MPLTPSDIESAALPLAILKDAQSIAGDVLNITRQAATSSGTYLSLVSRLVEIDPDWQPVMEARLTAAIVAAKQTVSFTAEQKVLIQQIVSALVS